MSTIHPPVELQALAAEGSAECTATPFNWRIVTFALGVAMLALLLRAWNISANFESSDQAAMGFMVHHYYGVKWLFAHEYGPMLAIIQRGFATLCTLCGLPLSEATFRIPMLLASSAQVIITFPLLRRMTCTPREALFGCLCCAVIPTLVTDAHYPWGAHTIWLLLGTVALWATVAYLQDRRIWQLVSASAFLGTHCIGGLYALALPLTLLTAWYLVAVDNRRQDIPRPKWRSFIAGYVLPCLAALGVIVGSHLWTGGGQIGRLLSKTSHGTFGVHFEQIGQIPGLWASQLSLSFGSVAALGVGYGVYRLLDKQPLGLLSVWAWNALWPIVLMTDLNTTGFPHYYLLEAVYPAGILGGVLIVRAMRWHLIPRVVVVLAGAIGLVQITAGSAAVVVPHAPWREHTGVVTGWGNVLPDTGIKAAAYYIREHAPENAVILSLHTNTGMEATSAQYYTGRSVLASYDLKRKHLAPLVAQMHDDVDLIIAETVDRALPAALDDFTCVCTITHAGDAVRFIYARTRLRLPIVQLSTEQTNPKFDEQYRATRIPIPLATPDGFEEKLQRYQATIKQIQKPPPL